MTPAEPFIVTRALFFPPIYSSMIKYFYSDKDSRARDRGEVSVLLHYEKVRRGCGCGCSVCVYRVLILEEQEQSSDTMTD